VVFQTDYDEIELKNISYDVISVKKVTFASYHPAERGAKYFFDEAYRMERESQNKPLY